MTPKTTWFMLFLIAGMVFPGVFEEACKQHLDDYMNKKITSAQMMANVQRELSIGVSNSTISLSSAELIKLNLMNYFGDQNAAKDFAYQLLAKGQSDAAADQIRSILFEIYYRETNYTKAIDILNQMLISTKSCEMKGYGYYNLALVYDALKNTEKVKYYIKEYSFSCAFPMHRLEMKSIIERYTK